jgi:hypothetical protein
MKKKKRITFRRLVTILLIAAYIIGWVASHLTNQVEANQILSGLG